MAYIDLAYLEQYAADYGEDISSYTNAQKTASINVACDLFLDVMYNWKGTPQQATSKLPTDLVEVNSDIQLAAAMATILNLKGRLFVDPTITNAQGDLIKTRRKIGELETENEYREGSQRKSFYPTLRIDKILQPYVVGSGLGRVFSW